MRARLPVWAEWREESTDAGDAETVDLPHEPVLVDGHRDRLTYAEIFWKFGFFRLIVT